MIREPKFLNYMYNTLRFKAKNEGTIPSCIPSGEDVQAHIYAQLEQHLEPSNDDATHTNASEGRGMTGPQ